MKKILCIFKMILMGCHSAYLYGTVIKVVISYNEMVKKLKKNVTLYVNI